MRKSSEIKNIGLLLSGLIFCTTLMGQDITIQYQSTDAPIANPERGWYDQYTTHSGGASLGTTYRPLITEELRSNREEDNITLILRLFMLHEFLEESEVNQTYLDNMKADFDSVRAAGVKCVVRFAYSLSQSAVVWDATPARVFSHIESLGDVLSDNSDVIAAVQAGFIGAWGEWYYTKNFAGQGYVPDEEDQMNRIQLVEGLLDVLPQNLIVEGRTPAIMKNLARTDEPISGDEAFDGSYKSRIGHHNDCFVASASDYGTYTNLEQDLAYLHETTKYTITGGETCDGSNIYSDCDNSFSRLETLHWTYMNRGYNRSVYEKWEEQGCYDEIDISLGYRLHLQTLTIPENVIAGASMNLTFDISNDGFAAPSQNKSIQIVLTHTVTKEQIVLPYSGTNEDLRFWLPGEVTSEGSVEIPGDTEDGNYIVGIRFTDLSSLLESNPAYSIQLANTGNWNKETGINSLNHIISVGTGGVGSLPAAPSDPEASTVSETEIDLTWTDNSEDESGFEIMRATGDRIAWEQIAIVDPEIQYYNDNNLIKGRYYHYIIRSINEYGFSAWSDSTTAATLGVSVPESKKARGMNMYPNPLSAGDALNLLFPDNSRKIIRIASITGTALFEQVIYKEIIQIDGKIFVPGIYIVSLVQQSENREKLLIVL